MSLLQKLLPGIELRPVTPRERAGLSCLALVAGIALAAHALQLREAPDARSSASAMRASLQSLGAQNVDMLSANASQARTRAVTASTSQIALIQAHTLLADYVQQAGLEGAQIKALKQSEPHNLRLSVTADYSGDGMYRLLRILANSEKSISVDSVQTSNGEPQKLKLDVRLAYLQERRP
jgi:hypothetical protein